MMEKNPINPIQLDIIHLLFQYGNFNATPPAQLNFVSFCGILWVCKKLPGKSVKIKIVKIQMHFKQSDPRGPHRAKFKYFR
jgi:hypothetical protein